MARVWCAVALALCAVAAAAAEAEAQYQVVANYTGESFFDNFDFYTDADPTNGYVDYVSRENATNWGFINATAESVFVGCDAWSVSSGRGRGSVRLQSKAVFNAGSLFVMDLSHMPSGCATWPAWWLCGPDWPNGGEIDIIEGVNAMTNDHTTLHTDQGCTMAQEIANGTAQVMTGTWVTADCWVGDPQQPANAGCSVANNAVGNSYGAPFNAIGGGMVVAEWTDAFIRAFFFPRNAIPADLWAANPQPSTWGLPYAYFALGGSGSGGECDPAHFHDLQMIINDTFCGDWAGSDFPQSCPNRGTCQSYTQNQPQQFRDAYWAIRSIAIYQQNGSAKGPAPAPKPVGPARR